MSTTQPPCRGSVHYFGPPTGLHGGQVCTCGERYGETIDDGLPLVCDAMTFYADLRDRLGMALAPAPLPIDLVERARALAAKIMAHDTSDIPIAKAPAPEQLPAIRTHLDEIRRSPSRLLMIDSDALHEVAERLRAERPDGFDQRAVDAAKAVLLAQVPRKGK